MWNSIFGDEVLFLSITLAHSLYMYIYFCYTNNTARQVFDHTFHPFKVPRITEQFADSNIGFKRTLISLRLDVTAGMYSAL